MTIYKNKLDHHLKKFLDTFDNAEILAKQLHALNINENAGDIILFGAFKNNKQITFEDQAGGHSAVGGEQKFPFILTNKNWKFSTSDVIFSDQLYYKLTKLKKQLGIS